MRRAVGMGLLLAVAAAVAGAEALGAYLEQQMGRRHLPEPSGPLRLVQDGAHEWISDGRIPVARLSRPPTSAAGTSAGDASFAIEFVLPMAANEATAIHAAGRIHAAIMRTAAGRVSLVPDEREERCA